MRFGVLGTGMVGHTIATKLISLGHEVTMGSRRAGNDKAAAWAAQAGESAHEGSFAGAASFGEVVVNATAGTASLDALAAAEEKNLTGKVLIDVANPLDSSTGMPPRLTVANTDSLGERIQRQFPDARVVKALNTMNCEVMVDPSRVPGSHSVFLCGNDQSAKADVRALLETFGWPAGSILDLGDLSAARGMEMYLPLWLRIFGALGTGRFNIALVRDAQ
ncbi:MAG: NADP oxidoreductase [Nitriliruptorales bacterium]|nr:NADP oxidoreductase [Nitriliruptorales bacterium]